MKPLFICIIVFCFSVTFYAEAYEVPKTIDISIPTTSESSSLHIDFVKELLAIIVESQNYSLNIIYQGSEVNQSRTIKLLSDGDTINLDWAALTDERQRLLATIDIPIYQGMIGWRVLYIRKNNVDTFSDIETLEQLKMLTAVQRFDWADYEILKNNGIKVEGNMSYEGQSKAVVAGLVDYYPRSVIEAVKEISAPFNSGLMIEPNLLLKYPSGYYFYVKKEDHKLAQIITQGFQKVIDNGQYQHLFDRYFADDLKQLKLEQRNVIHLIN